MPKITQCIVKFDRDLEFGESSDLYILAEDTLSMTPIIKAKGQHVLRRGQRIAHYPANLKFGKMIREQEDIDQFCKEIVDFAIRYNLSLGGQMDVEDALADREKTGEKRTYLFSGKTVSLKKKKI